MLTFFVVTFFPFRIVVEEDDEEKLGPPIDELELIELKLCNRSKVIKSITFEFEDMLFNEITEFL